MNRAIRRWHHTRICTRRLRERARTGLYRRWCVWPLDDEDADDAIRRKMIRNEGRPGLRLYPCGDTLCDWCIGSKTYRDRREAERVREEIAAWQSGEGSEPPTLADKQGRAQSPSKRRPSASKLRRDKRHCPVCLAPLPKNARRTRVIRQCEVCKAYPARIGHCPRCLSPNIWMTRQETACQGCGWHGRLYYQEAR